MSCHRLTTSGLESSRSQDTKGAEQLLVSPTRLLGLPEVTGLGCAVENFGEAALLRSVLVALFHEAWDLMGVVRGDDFVFVGLDEYLDFASKVFRGR